MDKKGFYLKYDKENDILNVSFGPAKEAISVEQEPEVYVRVDPTTHQIVGLTVLGFKRSFLSHKQELHISPPHPVTICKRAFEKIPLFLEFIFIRIFVSQSEIWLLQRS